MDRYYREVSFIPWFPVPNIVFGEIIFWKYDPSAIRSEATRLHLDKYFSRYVNIVGKPVDTITIVSYLDKNNFDALEPEMCSKIKVTRDILYFLCVAPRIIKSVGMNNNSIVPPSADAFQMVSQHFIEGADDISVQAGNSNEFGWKIDEVFFSKPLSKGGTFTALNKDLLDAFVLLDSDESVDLQFKNRIYRAIEWFRAAHIENDEISVFSKVVMMSTAFEILLEFSKSGAKKKFFSQKIHDLTNTTRLRLETHRLDKETLELCMPSWWAKSFYKLRNKIVHGDELEREDLIYADWITHLIAADIVFYRIIIEELYQKGFLNSKLKDMFADMKREGDTEANQVSRNLLEFLFDFSKAYKTLGWLNEI